MGGKQCGGGLPGAPRLRPGSFIPAAGTTLRHFFARELETHTYYAYGKVALRDGLRTVGYTESGNVLVPAYLPDGVVEPLYDLGLEPRYYAIERDLGPDLEDLETRIDDWTRAVMAVHYFGFPQPRLDDILSLAGERGLLVIDNSAHSPFSRRGSRLLGTFGDLGFTSLRKTLPLPDGALLIGIDAPEEVSSLSGHAPWFSKASLQHFVGKGLTFARFRSPPVRRIVNTVLARTDAPPLDAELLYSLSKVRMSSLSWYLTRTIDPGTVVRRRRQVYRSWLAVFEGHPAVSVLRDPLPEGVCPQAVPIVFDSARCATQFVREMAAVGIGGVHTWPLLRRAIRTTPEYETSTSLADRLVTVPCHQQLSPEMVTSVADDVSTVLASLADGERTPEH